MSAAERLPENFHDADDELMELDEVLVFIRMSTAFIYKEIKAERFPKPIKQGRRSFWLRSEVRAWRQARIEARQPEQA